MDLLDSYTDYLQEKVKRLEQEITELRGTLQDVSEIVAKDRGVEGKYECNRVS